jgi:hypothetical protein
MENSLERNAVSFATYSIRITKKIESDSDKLGEFSFDDTDRFVYKTNTSVSVA